MPLKYTAAEPAPAVAFATPACAIRAHFSTPPLRYSSWRPETALLPTTKVLHRTSPPLISKTPGAQPLLSPAQPKLMSLQLRTPSLTVILFTAPSLADWLPIVKLFGKISSPPLTSSSGEQVCSPVAPSTPMVTDEQEIVPPLSVSFGRSVTPSGVVVGRPL